MIEHGRISASQLGKILYMSVIPTSILSTPAMTYLFAKEDMWIAPIWAFSGLFTIVIVLQLHRLYPNENFVQILERIGGNMIGKLFGFIYMFYFLYLTGIIVREYSEFVVGAFLRLTPLLIITSSMIFVCALAVRGGLEIVARFTELFLPILIVLFLLNILPIIPDLQVKNIFPIMSEGVLPSLKASLVLQTWYSEIIIASFFLPFVAEKKNIRRTMFVSLFFIVLTLVVTNMAILLLLGDLTPGYMYPFLILARYLNFADFLTHLASLFMAIWVLGVYIKICIFFYVTVLVGAQWLHLQDYRPIVFPLALLLLLFSLWVAPNVQELSYAIQTSVTFSILTMFVVIPTLLLFFVWIKKRGDLK